MAIDFPNSPINGSTHVVGDTTWTFDGTKWNKNPTTIIGPTGPSGASGTNGATGATGPTGAGFANLPISGSEKVTSYSLQTSDIGRYVQVGTGGSIIIPNSTFSQGDIVTIINNTNSTITITCSITTAYIAGLVTDYASVTLASRGMATVVFVSGTVCYITGNVY